MKIAYLVAEFPKPSETFVSREVLSLLRLGMDIVPFSFTAPNSAQKTQLDRRTLFLAAQTRYLRTAETLGDALCGLPTVCGCWGRNRTLGRALSQKSDNRLRLLRAASLSRRLTAAGVTHLHAHWPYATQIAYLVHQMTGIPFSVSIHAHEVEHDAGHFPLVFEALSFASFCNRAAMEKLLQRLPASARAKSHLIYHGVDLSQFEALPFPASATPLRVISAGRLTKTKGFDRLVRACARFHAAGGAVELTILGEGTLEPELRAIAAQLDFSENLHLPGWLPHDQIAARLAESHLFALMADTNFHDGLPNVVLEAMATARPVVLSPLPAAAEAVQNGREGFVLSSAGDEAGFTEVLGRCAGDLVQLQTMGLAARRRVKHAFDENVHALRLKRLFEQVQVRALAA